MLDQMNQSFSRVCILVLIDDHCSLRCCPLHELSCADVVPSVPVLIGDRCFSVFESSEKKKKNLRKKKFPGTKKTNKQKKKLVTSLKSERKTAPIAYSIRPQTSLLHRSLVLRHRPLPPLPCLLVCRSLQTIKPVVRPVETVTDHAVRPLVV